MGKMSDAFITFCYERLSSQVLEQSATGSHSSVNNLYKNIPERSISFVISLDYKLSQTTLTEVSRTEIN